MVARRFLLLLFTCLCEDVFTLRCFNELELTANEFVDAPSNSVCAVHVIYDEAPLDIVSMDFFPETNSNYSKKLPNCYEKIAKRGRTIYHNQVGTRFYKFKKVVCRCKTDLCNEPELILNYLPQADVIHNLLKRALDDANGNQLNKVKTSLWAMLFFIIPSFLLLFGVVGGSGLLIKKYGFRKL